MTPTWQLLTVAALNTLAVYSAYKAGSSIGKLRGHRVASEMFLGAFAKIVENEKERMSNAYAKGFADGRESLAQSESDPTRADDADTESDRHN